jgi:hypothetical protein
LLFDEEGVDVIALLSFFLQSDGKSNIGWPEADTDQIIDMHEFPQDRDME